MITTLFSWTKTELLCDKWLYENKIFFYDHRVLHENSVCTRCTVLFKQEMKAADQLGSQTTHSNTLLIKFCLFILTTHVKWHSADLYWFWPIQRSHISTSVRTPCAWLPFNVLNSVLTAVCVFFNSPCPPQTNVVSFVTPILDEIQLLWWLQIAWHDGHQTNKQNKTIKTISSHSLEPPAMEIISLCW